MTNIDDRFSWVDEFISNIKPYIFIRTEDNVLIKRPNHVQKLNSMGAAILKFLTDGGLIEDLLEKIDTSKHEEVFNFLEAIRTSLEGKLDVFTLNSAVEKRPLKAPFTSLPVLSELAITYRCNFRCSFCYAGINCNRDLDKKELTFDELAKIIYKIRFQAKVPSISFTGGEPTMRNDLPELIKYAKNLGMRVNLISNGFLIDDRLALKLKKAGLDSVQLSVEGACAETHEKITGVKDSFCHLKNAVRNLQKQNIWVHTNTTLSIENKDEVAMLPQFLKKELNLERFSMNMVIPTGSAVVHKSILLTYSEVGKIIKKIMDASKKEDIVFMWYSPIPLCVFNTITNDLGNKGCAACDGLISIDSSGNIIPCASWSEPVGNLLEKDFDEIWNNKRSSFIRNKMETHEICRKCDNFDICQGGCPLYWQQNGFLELEKKQKFKSVKNQ